MVIEPSCETGPAFQAKEMLLVEQVCHGVYNILLSIVAAVRYIAYTVAVRGGGVSPISHVMRVSCFQRFECNMRCGHVIIAQ